MKRKLLALCILAICLTGCEYEQPNISTEIVETSVGVLYEFEPEGTLYIKFNNMIVPYYNKNGKMCHRVDGKVVEIDESN
jgi:hypothetical protein